MREALPAAPSRPGAPRLRVVVDAAHHRRLRADDHARLLLEAVDGVPHLVGRQLTHVAQVRHHRDVPPAHLLDLAQQREELVGVGVGREALRPKRERARADAQVLDVRQEGRVLEGLEVLLEDAPVSTPAGVKQPACRCVDLSAMQTARASS